MQYLIRDTDSLLLTADAPPAGGLLGVSYTPAYCTVADLLQRPGPAQIQLLLEAVGLAADLEGEAETQLLLGALWDAALEVNGYVGKVHPLPLPVESGLLRGLARTLALYLLTPEPTEQQGRDLASARKTLTAIGAGSITLGLPGPAAEPVSAGMPEFVAGAGEFGADSLRGY